jgi:hypothetical protein
VASVEEKTYPSPDGTLQAVQIGLKWKGMKRVESRIEIRDSSGKRLQWKRFITEDGEHGSWVGDCEWTPHGEYFVFNTWNPGGHQPWHHPIYFYSKSRNEFYDFDQMVGPMIRRESGRGMTAAAVSAALDGASADEVLQVAMEAAASAEARWPPRCS